MSQEKSKMPIQLYFVFDDSDRQFADELESSFSIMVRRGNITIWHPGKILGGRNVPKTIEQKVKETQIFVFIVTANFLASTYCYEMEEIAMRRQQKGEVAILPVIYKSCLWQFSTFKDLNALPSNGETIYGLSGDGKNRAIGSIVLEIYDIIKKQFSALPKENIRPTVPQKNAHSIMPINSQSIRNLLIQGELTKAIEHTLALAQQTKDSRHINNLIGISARNHSNEKDKNIGVISFDNHRMEQAKIRVALQSFLDDLERHYPHTEIRETETEQQGNTPQNRTNISGDGNIIIQGVSGSSININQSGQHGSPPVNENLKRMKDPILTGPQIEAFCSALKSAFTDYNALKRMLRFKLNKKLDTIIGRGALNQVTLELVDLAESEGWLYRLLYAARKHNPGNQQLIDFEQSIGLATREFGRPGLEAQIRALDQFISLNEWLPKLNAIEKQVCKVETPYETGTGFLIAPDVVLTNYHVVEAVIQAGLGGSTIKLRFDYKKLQGIGSEGEVHTLADKWLIDYSPYSQADLSNMGLPTTDELDYALLRLNKALHERGQIKIPDNMAELAGSYHENAPLFIVQHPDGTPLKLALDTQSIKRFNDNKTRLFYKTRTEKGSSGSPCFDIDWKWIALHHSGRKWIENGGIPVAALTQAWTKKGLNWKNNFV